jgi:carbonic anhydrase
MHKLTSAVVSMMLVFSQMAVADGDWGYTGNVGEGAWGAIGYPLCSAGKQQSPINITKAATARAYDELAFSNHPIQFKMKKSEQNLYAFTTNPAANTLQYQGDTYQLQSFHFHTPGEHEMNSNKYVLEGHFIHENSAGNPVVIAVLFNIGAPNAQFDNFIHAAEAATTTVSLGAFFAGNHSYYNYTGSLTVPPCTEGLTWVVLTKPQHISAAQLQYFKEHVIPYNTRTPQPLDGRVVTFHQHR